MAHQQSFRGQLWYDTADARLKLFNGSDWKVAGGPIVSNQQPNNLVAGDLWIDDAKNRLYFWDGTDLVLVGPAIQQDKVRQVLKQTALLMMVMLSVLF